MPAVALKIDVILDAGTPEDMVTASDSLLEPQLKQKATKVLEIDARVGGTQQDPIE